MSKLPWTKELPQKSGYYWLHTSQGRKPHPVEVYLETAEPMFRVMGTGEVGYLADVDDVDPRHDYWLPIEVPDPPET